MGVASGTLDKSIQMCFLADSVHHPASTTGYMKANITLSSKLAYALQCNFLATCDNHQIDTITCPINCIGITPAGPSVQISNSEPQEKTIP